MQFMLLIYGTHKGWSAMTEEAFGELMAGHGRLQAELRATGEFVATNELPLENAKIVRRVDGALKIATGPLNPDGDIIAGYYQVECSGIDRATEIAERLAEVEFGLIEVRQTSRDPEH
jgi:hypothetical protein